MQVSKILVRSLTLSMMAFLTACGGGGGGGDSGTKVVNTPVPTVTVVPFIRFSTNTKTSASIGANANEPTFFVDTGQVGDNFPQAGWLPFPAFSMDGYGTANASFIGYKGAIKADSKAFAICSQNSQASASLTASVNYPFQKGLEVFLSGYTRVTDFSEVNGMTFKEFDCAGTTSTKTFNSNNTITSTDIRGTNSLSSALFLNSNVIDVDGAKKSGFLFKISTTAGNKYFLATTVDAASGRYYTFSYQP